MCVLGRFSDVVRGVISVRHFIKYPEYLCLIAHGFTLGGRKEKKITGKEKYKENEEV